MPASPLLHGSETEMAQAISGLSHCLFAAGRSMLLDEIFQLTVYRKTHRTHVARLVRIPT